MEKVSSCSTYKGNSVEGRKGISNHTVQTITTVLYPGQHFEVRGRNFDEDTGNLSYTNRLHSHVDGSIGLDSIEPLLSFSVVNIFPFYYNFKVSTQLTLRIVTKEYIIIRSSSYLNRLILFYRIKLES